MENAPLYKIYLQAKKRDIHNGLTSDATADPWMHELRFKVESTRAITSSENVRSRWTFYWTSPLGWFMFDARCRKLEMARNENRNGFGG